LNRPARGRVKHHHVAAHHSLTTLGYPPRYPGEQLRNTTSPNVGFRAGLIGP